MNALATTQSEVRLARLLDERDLNRQKHESLLASIEGREDKTLNETEREHVAMYREKAAELDTEIEQLAGDIEAAREAVEKSKAIRRSLAGSDDSVEVDGDGIVYRTMAAYARDVILTSDKGNVAGMIQRQFADEGQILSARERLMLLKRTPANTLSSNVGGLQPPQHIAQIFQVINDSRPLVASLPSAALERGQLTYPKVTQKPVVAVQSSEKTEGGNQAMHVDLETTTASTYLGGGDLSWQAVQWSTPNALDLWFRLAAADYALKTEQDAAYTLEESALNDVIGSPLGSTPTFADFLTAVGAGAGAVFSNSGRTANTIWMAIDRYWYLFGLTSTALAQFATITERGIGPLQIIPSRGLHSGVIIVGDREGALVAETPDAPVNLNVVEPAIGGYEVGLIGAFEAVAVDDGAFAQITTAS